MLIPWNPFHFIQTWTGKTFGEFNWTKSIFHETMLLVRPTSTLQHFEKECGILLAWGKCFNLLWFCFQLSWYVNYNLYPIQEPHPPLLRSSSFFFCQFSRLSLRSRAIVCHNVRLKFVVLAETNHEIKTFSNTCLRLERGLTLEAQMGLIVKLIYWLQVRLSVSPMISFGFCDMSYCRCFNPWTFS